MYEMCFMKSTIQMWHHARGLRLYVMKQTFSNTILFSITISYIEIREPVVN